MPLSPLRVLVILTWASAGLAQVAPEPPSGVDAILTRARAACARNDQGAALACGLELRARDPADIRGHYLIGVASGSLGPRFSRIVAEQAFARVAALLRSESVAALRGLPGVSARADLDAISTALDGWRRDLGAGRRLMLLPEPTAAQRLAERLRGRIVQVEAWATRERSRLERARKQRVESDKALRREQTRKRRPGETFADVQPIVDKIQASERTIEVCTRRIGEFETQLAELRAELDRAEAVAGAMPPR